MADSAVPITSGSGTNIDTRTEGTNGHHRQVIVVGDPSTNAGVAPVDATAGLKVNLGADNDVTVTGTVAVTQSGAWAVTVSTAAVTNAGTFAVQEDGAALTALQAIKTAVELIDDAVAAEGAALGKGILIQADDGTDRQNLQIDDTSKGLKVELWGAGQSAGAAVQPTQADATGNGTNGLVTTGLLYGFNGTWLQRHVVGPASQ